MRETDGTVDEQTGAVGTAMAQHIAHPAKTIHVDGLTWVEMSDSGKATHRFIY